MNRLHFVEPEDAGEATREIFKNLVLIPNILCIMAPRKGPAQETGWNIPCALVCRKLYPAQGFMYSGTKR